MFLLKLDLLLLVFLSATSAFQQSRGRPSLVRALATPKTPTSLFGFRDFVAGRFRRNKEVEIAEPIEVGSELPGIALDVVNNSMKKDDNGTMKKAANTPMVLSQMFAKGTGLLVGMPGSDTCTEEHLPGYIEAATTLERKLGIDKIAVVTTDDKYVDGAWAENFLSIKDQSDEGIIRFLSDKDGEGVKGLGLADDMGDGATVRSKRFALLTEDGKVTYRAVDEGVADCSSTAANAIVEYLKPEGEEEMEEMDPAVAGGAILLLGGALLAAMLNNAGDASLSTVAPPVASSRPVIQKVANRPAAGFGLPAAGTVGSQTSSFSLLEQYMK